MPNDNHDEHGRFAAGGAGGALGVRMARFVTNSGVDARHDWMGKTYDRAEKLATASAHAVARAGVDGHHSSVPTFGRRR